MARRDRGFLSVVAFLLMTYTLIDVLDLYYDTLRTSQEALDMGLALDQMVYLESNLATSFWSVVDQSFGLAYGGDVREGALRYPVVDALFARQRFFAPCDAELPGEVQNATRRALAKWARAAGAVLALEGKEVRVTVGGAPGSLADVPGALTGTLDRDQCSMNGCCDLTFPMTDDPRTPPVSAIDGRYAGHDLCADDWSGCPSVPAGLPADICLAVNPCEVYEDAKTLAQYYAGVGHATGSLGMSNLFSFASACPECLDAAGGQTLTRDIRFPKCPEPAAPACRAVEGFAQDVGRGMGLAFLESCPYGKWHDLTVGVPVRASCQGDSRNVPWPRTEGEKALLGPAAETGGAPDDAKVESMLCSGYDLFDACGGAGLLDTARQNVPGAQCCLCNDTSSVFTTVRICLPCNNTPGLGMVDELADQLNIGGPSWGRERASLFADPVVDDGGFLVDRTCRVSANTCSHLTARARLSVPVVLELGDRGYSLRSSFEVRGERRIERLCRLRSIDWAALETACRLAEAAEEASPPARYQLFVGLGGAWADLTVESGVPSVISGFAYTDGAGDVNASAFGAPALVGALEDAVESNSPSLRAQGEDRHFADASAAAPAGVKSRCRPGLTCLYRSLEPGAAGGVPPLGAGLLAAEDSDDLRALLARNGTAERFWRPEWDRFLEHQYVDNLLDLTYGAPSLDGLGAVGAPAVLTRAKDCRWSPSKERCMRYLLQVFYGPLCRWGVERNG